MSSEIGIAIELHKRLQSVSNLLHSAPRYQEPLQLRKQIPEAERILHTVTRWRWVRWQREIHGDSYRPAISRASKTREPLTLSDSRSSLKSLSKPVRCRDDDQVGAVTHCVSAG
ncbi:hypothetical protein [Aureliella helgolandensis]|uniref:Uncharacterized protein n=1 Tax=Aureliella helgolandensis TaxID=2527968 RepID=A0A518G399_9BACT|nr:hypothetical protein [Aureliella helgolandensis]QDV23068.1 hypothetical protein Q31a_13630 [Aureliella helgolandensis]